MKKQNRFYSVHGNQTKSYFLIVLIILLFLGSIQPSLAEDSPSNDPRDKKIEMLEDAVKKLMDEIEALKEGQRAGKSTLKKQEESISKIKNQVEELDVAEAQFDNSWINKSQNKRNY